MNPAKPRLGFLGLGWIGTQRMEVVASSGLAEIVALADPSVEAIHRASAMVSGCKTCQTLDQLLERDEALNGLDGLDGLVIATPSALHAQQAIAALQNGIAVFCQKPLGRTLSEVEAIVQIARERDVLLGVDFSYRFTQGIQRIRQVIEEGKLGRIHAANLVFHNAYGPDKAWFYDSHLSGGGCVMDLGIHLVDLALLMIQSPVVGVSSRLFHRGKALRAAQMRREVEDFAIARLDFASQAVANLSCSWNLHAGQDAIIEATFYGEHGGASLRNLNGSFYDFTAELFTGTKRVPLALAPDAWGGRALLDWTRRLAAGSRFDAEVNTVIEVAGVVDAIYQGCCSHGPAGHRGDAGSCGDGLSPRVEQNASL